MSWLVSAKQYIPAVIGEPFGGGYFAGYISHTADGNPTHALIVAPSATGATGTGYTLTTNLAWKTANTSTANTTSAFDGAANTAAMVAAGIADHPAAQFCTTLTVGGFTDWYLPARFELEIAYFNLKPNSTSNVTNFGVNAYAVPTRSANYSASLPPQTGLTLFQAGQSQAFAVNYHYSSTQATSDKAWILTMGDGFQSGDTFQKTSTYRVRAFRRIAL